MKSTLYICYKIMAILMVLPVSNGFEDNIYNMGDEDPVQEKIDPEMDEPDDSGIIADSDPSIDEPPLIAISTDGYFKGVNVTTVKGVAIKYNDDIFYPTEAQPSPPPMHIDSSEMRRKFKQKSRTVDNFKPYPQKDDISPEAEGTSTIVTELPCNATAIEEDYYRSIMEHVAFDKCLAQVPDLTENDIQDYRTLSIYSDKAVTKCRNAYETAWQRVACVHIRINKVKKKFVSMRQRKRTSPKIMNDCLNRMNYHGLFEGTNHELENCEKMNSTDVLFNHDDTTTAKTYQGENLKLLHNSSSIVEGVEQVRNNNFNMDVGSSIPYEIVDKQAIKDIAFSKDDSVQIFIKDETSPIDQPTSLTSNAFFVTTEWYDVPNTRVRMLEKGQFSTTEILSTTTTEYSRSILEEIISSSVRTSAKSSFVATMLIIQDFI